MANRVLSIEIGSAVTRVLEMDYKTKAPKIYRYFEMDTPEGVYADGLITATPEFVAGFQQCIKSAGIRTTKTIFVLNSGRIATREAEIPNMNEKKVGAMIRANASEYFPVDLNLYELIHEVTGQVEGEGVKKLKVYMIALPKDIMMSVRKAATAMGLSLIGMDYAGNSVKQLMTRDYKSTVVASIKVEEDGTVITIMEDDRLLLQRNIAYGLKDAVTVIQNSGLFGENLTFAQALGNLRRRQCINEYIDSGSDVFHKGDADDDDNSPETKQLREEVTDALANLVGNVTRVLDYFMSTNSDIEIEAVYLTGLGSECKGLNRLLSNEANHRVMLVKALKCATLENKRMRSTFPVGEFYACVGATLKPMDGAVAKGGSSASDGGNDSLALPVIICGIFLIASIAIGAYAILTNMMLQTEQAKLDRSVKQKLYIEDIYNAYVLSLDDYAWAKELDGQTVSFNDELVAFIEELERKMPSEIRLLSFQATETSVNMSIEVASKEAAAKVIEQLRTFDSIMVGTVSSISDQKNDADNAVGFSVECMYVERQPSEGDTGASDTPAGGEAGTESAPEPGTTEGGEAPAGSTESATPETARK